MWGWIVLIVVLIVLYLVFKPKKQSIVTRGKSRLRNLGGCCLKKLGLG